MNEFELDKALREEFGGNASLPPELDHAVRQRMETAAQQSKQQPWLIVAAVASVLLAAVEMLVALSFVRQPGLRILLVAAHIAVVCLLIFYAVISSTNMNKTKKGVHYG